MTQSDPKNKKQSTATAAAAAVVKPANKNKTHNKVPQHPSVAAILSRPQEAVPTALSTERVAFLGMLLLLVGTLGFYWIPGMIVVWDKKNGDDGNSNSSSNRQNYLVDAFYCAAITLTTVGFGDICPGPETPALGKAFLVLLTICGLGMFCGPVMTLASSWKDQLPQTRGRVAIWASFCLGAGVLVFTTMEGLTEIDAIYASIITGTTIGYGDFAPKTNIGKIAVAVYAIASVNVMAVLLEPARSYLEQFCRPKIKKD